MLGHGAVALQRCASKLRACAESARQVLRPRGHAIRAEQLNCGRAAHTGRATDAQCTSVSSSDAAGLPAATQRRRKWSAASWPTGGRARTAGAATASVLCLPLSYRLGSSDTDALATCIAAMGKRHFTACCTKRSVAAVPDRNCLCDIAHCTSLFSGARALCTAALPERGSGGAGNRRVEHNRGSYRTHELCALPQPVFGAELRCLSAISMRECSLAVQRSACCVHSCHQIRRCGGAGNCRVKHNRGVCRTRDACAVLRLAFVRSYGFYARFQCADAA